MADTSLILLRIGEIFLKGRNRERFVKTFIRQARWQLRDIEGTVVTPRYLRIEVECPTRSRDAVIACLGRVFGLHSMSPAVTVDPNLDAIREVALALARKHPTPATFKVETNRRDKTFPLISPAVSREVGGYIDDETELTVDVRNPELTIQVEITHEEAYVFGEVIAGPGGLPLGSGGRAGLLLSGGIDSPVAGWSAMRRGILLMGVYFHSFPYTGDKTKEKVLTLARELARWQGKWPVWVVDFTEAQKALRAAARADLAVLMYRRMMMRTASILISRNGGSALITGENIGQVASQTLENLGVIAEAATLPVLRPLLCYDKTEIIRKAKAIGTFETSILPYDDCCSLFVPKHPATRARLIDLAKPEATLDLDEMAMSLADNAERFLVE